MKQIVAFQTSDNQTFTDREKAEGHELSIFIRGLIQSNATAAQVTVKDFADIIVKKQELLADRLTKYRRTVAGIKASKMVKNAAN